MNHKPASNQTMAQLMSLTGTIAEAEGPDEIFASVADAAKSCIDYKLLTIMAFDAERMRVTRLYSSNPDTYPLGGGKEKRDTPWGRQVLIEGRPFISASKEDIRENFDDHNSIFELGLKSVMNIPVRIYGRTIGTLNFLNDASVYNAQDLEWGLFLAAQLIGPVSIEYNPDGIMSLPLKVGPLFG